MSKSWKSISVAVCLATGPLCLRAQYTTQESITVGTHPHAIAVNPITNKVYVANNGSGSVTVIDGATYSTTSIGVGTTPDSIAVDPATNKIYVVNEGSASVSVIDGATNAVSTLPAGTTPIAVAVDSLTNKIYVANRGSGDVTVIDGATNATTTVPVGTLPLAIGVNPATNKIYAANSGAGTVTVIDGATNATTTVPVGALPSAIGVNPVTDTIYVANNSAATVTAIDGATNATTTISTGIEPIGLAVNPVTNQVYVTNNGDGTVTVIDGATQATSVVTAGPSPNEVAVDTVTGSAYVATNNAGVAVINGTTMASFLTDADVGAYAVAVNPVTHKIFVANYNVGTVTVIDGALDGVPYYDNTTSAAFNDAVATISTGTGPSAVAVNPITDKIYVANNGSNNVTVIDGATNATSAVPAGTGPIAIAVNPITDKIYVANNGSNNVTVIDGATNATSAVPAGTGPIAIAVNPVTNKIYVANQLSGDATIIDGAGGASATVSIGVDPDGVAVDSATNEIYISYAFGGDFLNGGLMAIDGLSNATENYDVTLNPDSVGINPVTDKIYVGTGLSLAGTDVTIIDVISGTTDDVNGGYHPDAIAINPISNKIYIGCADGQADVIDGATNAVDIINVGISGKSVVAVNPVINKAYVVNKGGVYAIDGLTNGPTILTAQGTVPAAVAISPVTNKIYVANNASNNVTVLTEEPAASNALSVGVGPLAGNQTANPSPSFTFTPESTFSGSLPVSSVYFQVDTWQGAWTQASAGAGFFAGTAPSLPLGFHILYAFATDGQEAGSTQVGSPIVGAIAAYGFIVTPLTFTEQPVSQTVATGHTAVFNAVAPGAVSYQWSLNGYPISGATDPILEVTDATSASAGTYTCTATGPGGTATSATATLSVESTSNPGYLDNLSGRGPVGVGAANGLFPGFVITGTGTKSLLLRGVGPRLAADPFDLSDAIATPSFTLFDSTSIPIVTDAGWGNALLPGGSTDNVGPELTSASFMASVGAFSLPTGSADCAMQITAGTGAYTAEETGLNGATGVGLVEIYDADLAPPSARLVNISVRAPVGTGDGIIIAGFVIGGDTAETVLVRGVGPRLASAPFNLTGVLAQPVLAIYSGSTPIYSDTGWGGDPVLSSAMSAVGAYAFSASSQDSALLVTLPPGAYTALMSGLNGTIGIGSVEVYEVP